jgi:hypothetical protein
MTGIYAQAWLLLVKRASYINVYCADPVNNVDAYNTALGYDQAAFALK